MTDPCAKRPMNTKAWRQKSVIVQARPTIAVGADEINARGYESEQIEFPAKYYLICTNMKPYTENKSIEICTYAEPLDCETLEEALAAAKKANAEGKICPYCGHNHFRAKDGEGLSFDRRYATQYFFVD